MEDEAVFEWIVDHFAANSQFELLACKHLYYIYH